MTNLVVGKFYPPHLGHHYLIDQALDDGPTVVLVLWSERESITGYHRAAWLQDVHPTATVITKQDEYPVDYDSDEAWANHVGLMHHALRDQRRGYYASYAIDKVFGSEPYVERLATYFDAEPVIVDVARKTVPVSGTAVRADVRANWRYLAPPVRAGLCKRIVCVGAESCGTTTLARDLASYYDTVWVPEYGRMYSEGIRDQAWTHRDLEHIAEAQRGFEAAMALHAESGLLICDTNALATCIWDEFLVGRPSEIRSDRADLFILTDFCPWEDDGLRNGKAVRAEMQNAFIDLLRVRRYPWIEVSGSRAKRLATAVKAIDRLTWKFNSEDNHE